MYFRRLKAFLMLILFSTVDGECEKQLETKLTGKDTDQQSPVAIMPFHTASASRMEPAGQVSISQVVTHLKQLQITRDSSDTTQQGTVASSSPVSTGTKMRKYTKKNARDIKSKIRDITDNSGDTKVDARDTKDNMIAVKLHGYGMAGVWVLDDTKFVKLCDVPKECPAVGRICLVLDDIVVVCEGVTLSFSLSTKQWKRLNRMPAYRGNSSAVAIDNRMMILGGLVNRKESNVCDILHVKLNKWSTAAPLPKPLIWPLVALIAGKIYILPHDILSGSNTQPLVYDPLSNTYSHRAHLLSNIRSTQGACLVGVADMLYLLVGEEGLAWQYSPHTDQWMQLVTPTAQYYPFSRCCVVVRDNKILLCGGSTKDRNELNMIEEYNIVTQQWKVLDICLPFGYYQANASVMIASM